MLRWIAASVVLIGLVVFGFYIMPYFSAQTGDSPGSPPLADAAASTNAADPPPAKAEFDARRAMGYLAELCKIGPRISGTEGMKKQRTWLKKHFEGLGAQVEEQAFQAQQRSRPRQPVEMVNLIVKWHPERTRRVILCSHFDTRPIADEEEQTRKWTLPFISANDGGSGVALLMELAHHMKDLPASVGVDFVFFDGEEYIFKKDDQYFFGSSHFANQYRRSPPKHVYLAAILLDMIGGKDPHFPPERNSVFMAPKLVNEIWRIAAEQKCTAFVNREGHAVDDDHVPLNQGGIPAIDIIDFDYPHWHRLTDTPENCSADGLEQVARVLMVWLQRVK